MNPTDSVLAVGKGTLAAVAEEDRRYNDRVKFTTPIRIRRQNSSRDEEVGTMIDLARDGLFFAARFHDYPLGAELRLYIPATGAEWTCEVVRTELLPNGSLGIGVRIIL
jgi:PilZ domain-containing protein